MILFLTMAGRSERFKQAGISVPKYLLPWGESTVLSRMISIFRDGGAFDDIFLIANTQDDAYMPHVRAILRAHHIPETRLASIAETTGQAETAFAGVQALNRAKPSYCGPIAIHNIDTLLQGRNFPSVKAALAKADGYIDVFRSHNPSYSFVNLASDGTVTDIVEKRPISDLATSGFYAFSSPAMYKEYFDPQNDEYISSIYKRMIGGHKKIVVGPLHTEADTLVLGTPQEYFKNAHALDVEA